MRRKIKHSKRFADYPKNVPRRLLKEFRECYFSVSQLAQYVNVNSGIVSQLLNDGKEPMNTAARVALHLPPNPICPLCKRKVIKIKTSQKKPQPDYMKKWKHLSAEERNRAIYVYISWRKKDG